MYRCILAIGYSHVFAANDRQSGGELSHYRKEQVACKQVVISDSATHHENRALWFGSCTWDVARCDGLLSECSRLSCIAECGVCGRHPRWAGLRHGCVHAIAFQIAWVPLTFGLSVQVYTYIQVYIHDIHTGIHAYSMVQRRCYRT